MMKTVEVHHEMIGAVKAFLANREGFSDANGWSGLFNYSWKLEGYPYGYAILDGERMVAFVGAIFSEREMDGRKRICCNINTWYVEEQYRPKMLAVLVLSPILKMKDVLTTALSSSDISFPIFERMGFKSLDSEQIAIPILPLSGVFGSGGKKADVIFDKRLIAPYLDDEDRKIFTDHSSLDCHHFLIRDAERDRYCYGVATTTPIRKLRFLKGRWLNLCYVSDREVLKSNFSAFQRALWLRKFFWLRYDARLVPDDLAKRIVRKKKARQYKWSEAGVPQVDNLYSELVTFGKY